MALAYSTGGAQVRGVRASQSAKSPVHHTPPPGRHPERPPSDSQEGYLQIQRTLQYMI